MSLLLRMVLIGLTPLVMAALGVLLAGGWGLVMALALVGTGLAIWMYQHWVIRPLNDPARVRPQLQRRQMETVKFPLLGPQGEIIDLGFVSTDIADLAASREKFACVFHASPDWIVIARLGDSVIVEANEGFERISGHSRQEVIGHRMIDLNIWLEPAQRAVIVERLLRDGTVRDALVQLRRRDGEVRDCIVNATLIALEGQTNSHAVWIARDVTEEYAVNAQFSAAFHLTPDFMSISRLSDGRYVEVNEAFERITGYRRDEVIGRTSLDLGIWHDAAQRQALLRALERKDSVREFPIDMCDRHGKVRETLVNASIFEARGERYMVGLLRDVTEERRAEKALRESEARFASLFELSPLPMSYAFDSDGYTQNHRNEAFHTTFGYSREATSGHSAADLGLWVNPSDGGWAQQMRQDEKPVSNRVAEMKRADGSHLWISISVRFIVEPHRKMMVITLIDVSDQRRAQQGMLDLNAELEDRVTERTRQWQNANVELSQSILTLGQAKDQLVQAEKLAALGALVAGVAHELNTPIGNGLTVASSLEHKVREFLLGMAGGLKRSTLDQFVADMQFAADILVRNLTRAGTLVSSFKQVAVDQTSSQRRKFAMQALVAEIVMTLSPAIRQSGCQVVPHIAAGLLLDSYPGPLGQVLTNLINNAMIHGFEPGQAGRIDIRSRDLGPLGLELSVRDNGRGIEPAHLKRIFDPFFTTRLGHGGSGLGLHIVHNIVTGVLGGSVEVRSAPGEGAEFVLRLPLTAPALEVFE